MLKMKHLVENKALAQYALRSWNHDQATLEKWLNRFRISSNAVYPFMQDGSLAFLRLAPEEEKQDAQVQAELDFLAYLHAQGYPAMQSLPSLDGAALVRIDSPWGRYLASAFACVPGVPVEDAPPDERVMTRYGEALGRLHALSARYVPVRRRQSHADALAWTARTLAAHHAPDCMLEVCDRIACRLSAMPKNRETYGLVHYDFEPDNVFWDEAQDCCHVIDFDDSMYHFYVLDIEQALDALDEMLSEQGRASFSEAAQAQFLAGYRLHFPLSEDMLAQRPLMRAFCDIYAYARLLHCLSDRPSPEPEWMPGLCARLEGRMRHLEARLHV
ncbi:MAG: phosphotransferase [Clostridia bacterium]|nr:phosphotransferase [Clostridia bacterium]